MASDVSDIWQRHVAVDQALFSYYDLEMRSPSASNMVATGELLSEQSAFENETWRNMIRAIAAIISQIFYASRDQMLDRQVPGSELANLRDHGDRAIATIVGRSWRSLHAVRNHFSDHHLRNQVNDLIQSNREIDTEFVAEAREEADSLNA
jgi:hypothetical protein